MKLQSHTITQGKDRAPARAMLKGIGFTDEDLAKPIIGVANTWIETMPCNYNLRELAVKVKEGIRAAGGTPMEFNTIAISDGVTMGTEGSYKRQGDILHLICKGLRNAEIASHVQLSERTVKGYISQLFLIFDVMNRTELVGKTTSEVWPLP